MNMFEDDIDPEGNFFNHISSKCDYYTEEKFNKSIKQDQGLSIIHFNSRSLYANFGKIDQYLKQFTKPFNIIAVSETWLNQEKGLDNLELYGYELNYRNRANKGGGGVALYIDRKLRYKIIESMSTTINDVMECITIEICMGIKRNVMVSCVYRTPGSNIDIFTDVMERMFAKIDQKVHFVCGDYNIDLLNPNKHKKTDEFIDTMLTMSLLPTITKPSRVTSYSATLIDNIYTNCMDSSVVSGLLLNDISDHLPVFVVYECDHGNAKDNNIIEYKRVRTVESLNAFRTDLLAQAWEEVYNECDVDRAYDVFLERFQTLYDQYCPLQQCNRKQRRIETPWITKGLQNASKKKNSLYRKFIKHRTTEAELKYKKYKNKLTNIMRSCKKEYYNKLVEKNKNNSKGIWNILNSIIRKGTANNKYPDYFIDNNKTINDMNNVVNEFNDFFVNVGPRLADSIPDRSGEGGAAGDGIDMNSHSMFLRAVEENEIIDILNTSKNKTSTDWNGFDMTVLKEVGDGVAKPLSHIFNLSFQKGIFPGKMKTAKVIPVFKTGDKHQFTNYRPVSLLSQFSKILEKLFVDRLDNFIEKHNLLSDSQYGFRTSMSTNMALMELTEEITNSIDKGKYAVGIFVDLKKAFDTINHDILISKMERYGIRGVVLKWLKSYISNRQQFVQLGNHKSSFLEIKCGVPQGSVIGPKLFILYINDIYKVSKKIKIVTFADDTNILCSGDNLQQLLDMVKMEINKLKIWFDVNKLSLNLNKTKLMIFGNRKIDARVQLVVDQVEIEQVYEIKFLGVLVDCKLSWKQQIKYVRSKISRSIAVLGKAKHILEQRVLYILYCSLVVPYLTYCVEVWGNAYKTTLQPLCILQKRALRTIHHAGYRDHTNMLFLNSKCLKFMDLVKFKTAQIINNKQSKEIFTSQKHSIFI